jgi:hypothetical protein
VDARIDARDLCARGGGGEEGWKQMVSETVLSAWNRLRIETSKNDQQQQKRTTQGSSTLHF